MPTYQDLSQVQTHLKHSILKTIDNKLVDVCTKVVQDYLQKTVYDAYIPDPSNDYSYDRTMDLLNSVTVGEVKLGVKFATFEVYMDSEKIKPQQTEPNQWNQHQSQPEPSYSTSEYIPMWVEEGTSGSLWDREGAHYMAQSYIDLDNHLARELADRLKLEGWNVIAVS